MFVCTRVNTTPRDNNGMMTVTMYVPVKTLLKDFTLVMTGKPDS